MSVEMMREGWVAPTLNLAEVDPRCADLDYVMGAPRPLEAEVVMSNNFAFGGVNTSLLFRRFREGGSSAPRRGVSSGALGPRSARSGRA
jgi:3-oxoacyl-[acyl-carrier-protein] synthase II